MAIKLTVQQMTDIMFQGGIGFCTECEEESGSFCEPDAREYHCANCDTNTVYGAEELLLMDGIEIVEKEEDAYVTRALLMETPQLKVDE